MLITTPRPLRFWLPPWPGMLAAYQIGRRVAGAQETRAASWHELRRLDLTGAGAVIIGLPDGYAIHRTCRGSLGAIVARIYLLEDAPPPFDGTRATWRVRQQWAARRAMQLRAVCYAR